MRLVFVTGMSGAGKSTALNMLEDFGYYCMDNLPVALIGSALSLFLEGKAAAADRIAIGVDVRSGNMQNRMEEALDELDRRGIGYEILFLDASDEILLKRFKETRRVHPLAGTSGRIQSGLSKERVQMAALRKRAAYLIDTGNLLTRDLNDALRQIFFSEEGNYSLYLTILTFGYKYGIPQDADLVFDVRFLPNPYYVENMRKLTGLDDPVRQFVLSYGQSAEFLDRTEGLLRFLIPHYIEEGKRQLITAIGCTGGCHRSVVLAGALCERLRGSDSFAVRLSHRDLKREVRAKE